MQYTYYSTCDNIDESIIEDKPIKLHELESYMTKFENSKKESNNDIFTKLLINGELHRAVKMIDNNIDIKYNIDLYYDCHDGIGSCESAFNNMIKDICKNSDYINVIKLLQFLEPKNMIGGSCCDKLTLDYHNYCWHCINSNYINTARAIYIMFNVDSSKLLSKCCCKDNVKQVENAYNIITQSQDIIPLKRRNIPILDIVGMYDSYNIMKWYYDVNPMTYTKDEINKLLEKVKLKNHTQLFKFKKFFNSIVIE